MMGITSRSSAGIDVSRETEAKLQAFADLVTRWTSSINLVSRSSIAEIWDRHIIDSAQLYDLAPEGWQTWADIGSGGGFPGIVIAIIATERHPTGHVTLIESDQRKSAFLRTAIRELSVQATVVASRVESIPPLAANVLSARALGSLSDLLPIARRHLAPSGQAIFPKGRKADEEILAAQAAWHFEIDSHPSRTDPEAQILTIKNITHV